jgi:hypothetical protein
MTKKYIAYSHVAFNVVLPSGKSYHVSFAPLTGGGSMLITSNEDLQKAIEKHYKFGKLFKIDVNYKDEPEVVVEEAAAVEEPKVKVMKMASLDDAKAYLADNFGISRTKLRSKKQIEDAAAANGIEFSFE